MKRNKQNDIFYLFKQRNPIIRYRRLNVLSYSKGE